MVRTRNIFDPDRRPMVTSQPTPATVPIKQSDYVALTGTMISAGKELAFFSGSRSDFNKVLAVRDSIAGATIKKITAAGVDVERGGKKITVTVGQTVPLDNSAPPGAAPLPQPVLEAAAAAAGSAATAAAPATGGTAPAPAAAPGASPPAAAAGGLNAKQQEIMKRMMEKRKQDGL